jgi:hypothetical protein
MTYHVHEILDLPESDLIYRLLSEKDRSSAEEVLLNSFSQEPCGIALGISSIEWKEFIRFHLHECLNNGLSIGVFDSKTQELMGLCINLDFASVEEEDLEVLISKTFRPLLSILLEAEEPYKLHLEKEGVLGIRVKVFHILMLGVRQQSTMPSSSSSCSSSSPSSSSTSSSPGRRGIGQTLARLSVELARKKGFERCLVETSGAFSHRCFERLGFKEFLALKYAEYEWRDQKDEDKKEEKVKIFASIPPPHDRFALQELNLRSTT